ncbi:2Fe-2S iron-sulfur cluster-binding protein [uncultured Microscilla sp.]|uniref:2Fe-2S iron-sulfur cluster-binding protein n=1 Tax=uncultured Microscilla sp. TaxID=432653 RepID=UPI0026026DAC|nr:2Fe-2S iron-sulfur cluster-binding protein [uncultured Microscilla sp.]
MPKITIKNLNNQEVDLYDPNKSVLQHLGEAYIDWMQACGGKGRCTTCAMVVHNGTQYLNALTAAEEKFKNLGRLNSNQRLACQCVASGDIVISTPEKYQLPHVNYSDN